MDCSFIITRHTGQTLNIFISTISSLTSNPPLWDEIKSDKQEEKMNQPIKKYKAGSIRATVWENEVNNAGVYQTVSIERVYQDKEGNWKNTSSFRLNDLPKVNVVIQKIYQELTVSEL